MQLVGCLATRQVCDPGSWLRCQSKVSQTWYWQARTVGWLLAWLARRQASLCSSAVCSWLARSASAIPATHLHGLAIRFELGVGLGELWGEGPDGKDRSRRSIAVGMGSPYGLGKLQGTSSCRFTLRASKAWKRRSQDSLAGGAPVGREVKHADLASKSLLCVILLACSIHQLCRNELRM